MLFVFDKFIIITTREFIGNIIFTAGTFFDIIKVMENQNKIKLLKLWEILKEDSDENNPLSTNELLKRLSEIGIACDRRTLYNDIEALNRYGYEVMCELKEHSNHYYVGERAFDVPELKILMDAVTAACFISNKKTYQLHNKIAALAGNNRAELLKKSQNSINLIKQESEEVFYIVNELDEAISTGQKVSFLYQSFNVEGERFAKHNGERYITNPLETTFSGDRYYLIAYSETKDSLTQYRIDRMKSIKIENEKIEQSIRQKVFNLAEYKQQLFSMFSGETQIVSFEADNSLIDVVYDKFGSKIDLKDIGGKHFSFDAAVQISPVFFGWCFSFGDRLKVISPNSIVKKIKGYLHSVNSKYV